MTTVLREPTVRVYVTADPTAKIKAFANTREPYEIKAFNHFGHQTNHDSLHVSYDGTVFYTVLYVIDERPRRITQPALGIIDEPIDLMNGNMYDDVPYDRDEVVYNGVTYAYDETATVGEIIRKSVGCVLELVETHLGFYVIWQDLFTGELGSHLNGQLMRRYYSDHRAIRDGVVVHLTATDSQNDCYIYTVPADRLALGEQTAYFNGQPATRILDREKYEITFADDLSTVTVTKK